MTDTIFSRIIAGEIPCHKVYEDDSVLAFLDINPMSEGHTLVVPKVHADTLDMLPEETAAAVGRVLPRISRAVLRVTGATEFNVLQNNGPGAYQLVSHVHFHIIPKYPDGRGLGILGSGGPLDRAQGEALASKIARAISEGM